MTATSILAAIAVLISVLYVGVRWLKQYQSRAKIIKDNDCKPPPHYKHKDPILGLDYVFATSKAFDDCTLLDKNLENFKKYGPTFQITQAGSEMLMTRDWRLLKSCMSTDFDSWGSQDIRYEALRPLLGRMFFIRDGLEWKHKRAQTRPALAKNEYGDLQRLEKHLERFMKLIPRDASINMDEPFGRLMQNVSTEYFLGETVDMLSSSITDEHKQMIENIDVAMQCMISRMMMGSLVNYLPVGKKFTNASEGIKAFVDKNITSAIERRQHKSKLSDEEKPHRIFLDDMLEQTSNRADIRDAALGVYVAGVDTTRSTMVSVVWALARNPETVKKMRSEILETCSSPPQFGELQQLKFVRAAIWEIIRLYGASNTFNFRAATKDTTLPRGGGADGKSPIFVPKGTVLMMDYHALHRDPESWGPDVLEFRPERFLEENKRDFYMFQPFGGGPRNCPGQNLAFTNLLYITTRLLQEFKEIQPRDERPYQPHISLATKNKNGAEVAFVPA